MVAGRPAAVRSKVTNGTKLLVGTDGRSTWARRFRDLYAAFISDAGGDDAVTEGQRTILRRAAVLATELERIESVFAANGQADAGDLDLYGKTSAVLSRLLEKVGLERRPKDITPDLSTYIASKAVAKPAPAPLVPLPPLPTLSTPICADPK